MTKREQVLVIAMAGALVWGAYSLVTGIMKGRSGKEELAVVRDELRSFADTQRVTMQQLRLADREKMVLNEAMQPWAGSPFLIEAQRARPAEERVVSFRYTGFLQIGGQQFAIVNGREYRVSDPIHATDFVVDSIHPDHVVLAAGTGGRRVTVELQPSNVERKSP